MGSLRDIGLRIAVAEGILSTEEAEHLEQEAVLCAQPPLDLLRQKGRLSDESLASLRFRASESSQRAVNIDAKTLTAPPRSSSPPSPRDLDQTAAAAATPSSNPDPSAFPVTAWDRYQPLRLLGEGGMGRVFLARDNRLQRDVAIKFIRGDDPALVRRFVTEARSQARVSHEYVCKVYEVGEIEGKVYIAMQWIDGETLSDLSPKLGIEQKALLVQKAALGVHEANRAGFIHRDIKPSNIMAEQSEEGEWRPYVMDFGIARSITEDATVTGAVLGTPHFMSPEQARGETTTLDRRADVYSLGATLYTMLAGEPPFPGGNALSIINHVLTVEPRALRAIDANVPEDLEAIVMKCLEKDRGARYDSARALADDLGRFLDGEPVSARARTLGYRLRKKVRKHARLVALIGAALLLVLLGLGFGLKERRDAALRERLARRFTELVEQIESIERYSSLSPLHDIREDHQKIRIKMQALEEEIRVAGANAEGSGHYALGRGALALGDNEQARHHLELAWSSGFREPRAAYALALVLGHQYRRALVEAEEIRTPELREEQQRLAEQTYRAPALAYLRLSTGANVPSARYMAALTAFYENRLDDALAEAGAAGKELPWFYEAPQLLGDILSARASSYRLKGQDGQAQADLEAARGAYSAAAAIGESKPEVYLSMGQLEYSILSLEMYGKGNVQVPYDWGIEATRRVLVALPEDYEALVLRTRLRRSMAEYQNNRGRNIEDLLVPAIADTERATDLAPDRPEARLEQASLYRQWGEYKQSKDLDPSQELKKATEVMDGLGKAHRNYTYYTQLCLTFMVWADYQDGAGVPSEENRSKAIDACTQAIALNDRMFGAWLNLGINHYARASLSTNRDVESDLQKALDALEKGRQIAPSNIVPYFYGGEIHALLAVRKRNSGGDPGPELQTAMGMYEQGLTINPKMPQLHNGVGTVLCEQAANAWDRGDDPMPFLDKALTSYERAQKAAPDQGFAYGNAGYVQTQRARFLRIRGDDPNESVKRALEVLKQAIERGPGSASVLMEMSNAYLILAEYEQMHGHDPKEMLSKAHIWLEQARQANPLAALPATAKWKGFEAQRAAHYGEGRDEDFIAAEEVFQQAVKQAPEDLDRRLDFAYFYRAWALWLKERGRDIDAVARRCLNVLKDVLNARPGWPDALVLQAEMWLLQAENMGQAEEKTKQAGQAADVFAKALVANRNLEKAWKNRMKAAELLSSRPRNSGN